MPRIDPTARVADGARLADDVQVGPYCIVGPQVELQPGVRLVSHVNVAGVTRIGDRTIVYPFASLGTPPQSTGYRGGATRLQIGADCIIREGVTMNTGTEDGGGVTQVGDRGFFMNYCHVGHDCAVGNDVVFANQATLAGHCIVDDHVFISGLSAAHQFTQIGAHAMISGLTGLRGDVIPFAIAVGPSARLTGINVVGMRRRQYSKEAIRAVRLAYRALFSGAGDLEQRTKAVETEFGHEPAVAQIIAFVRRKRRRPLCFPASDQESDAE